MKNAIRVMVIVSFFLLLSRFSIVTAVDRFAECDACGYCRNRPAPENWNDCAVCLYAQSGVTNTTQASENKTLLIDQNPASPNANKPPSPASGKYFTQLGCVNTGLASFRDPSAAGGVLNFLLMNLIFPTVGTLAFGTIIYGGFLLATAQGEHMKILQGRRLVLSAIVGLVFTFSSILIINTVGNDILRIPGMRAGTKVTFVGWGNPTTQGGVKTYPNMSLFYDGKEIGKIDSLRGTASSPESREIYLPKKIDLSSDVDILKVQLVFTNDLDIKTAAEPDNDRNVHNFRILFDDKVCAIRRLGSRGTSSNVDGDDLANNWGNEYYVCDALVP